MNSLQLDINSEVHIKVDGLTDDQVITVRNLIEAFAIKNHDDRLLNSIQDTFSQSGDDNSDHHSEATPKIEKPTHPTRDQVPATSVSLGQGPLADPATNQIVLGKCGKKYIFNHSRIEELYLNQNMSQAQLAELAGVNVITMRKYLSESGLAEKKTGVRSSEPKSTPPAAKKKQSTLKWSWTPKEKSLQELRDSIPDIYRKDTSRECPVCGKIFTPAPQHIYKNKKGQKVCSYTCARKSGWWG